MAMKFTFDLQPYGDANNPIKFGEMRISTRGVYHCYAVDINTKDGWTTRRGSIAKRKSGHRNFLHLLAKILEDMDLDNMENNYVNVWADVKEIYPCATVGSDYPEG